jgi:hypothetical protein
MAQTCTDDEVVSHTRRQPFTPQEDSWYSIWLEAESTPGRLEGLGQVKKYTSSGLDPATFPAVA